MSLEPTKRPDLSHGLLHLTRERLDAPGTDQQKQVTAFEVLKEILQSSVLRGSGNNGFVKGDTPAVCLSEMPLSAVPLVTAPEDKGPSKFRPYGLAFSKKGIFLAGGRPVIYLPDQEGTWIPDSEKWRHVRFEQGSVDWTHEREWRLPGDLNLQSVPGIYVIVWSATEARELYDWNLPLSDRIRGVLPMEHLSTFL